MDIIDFDKKSNSGTEVQQGFFNAEIPFLILAAIGTLFKLLHWPGTAIFLFSGLGIFSIYLLIGGLFYKFWQLKVINVLSAAICIGILFKLLTWVGFQSFLYIGALSAVVATPFFILLIKQEQEFLKKNRFISFRIISLVLICWSLSIMGAQTYYKTFINDDPIGATLYEKAANEPGNEEAHKAYLEYRKSLNRPYSIDSSNVTK